MPTITVKSQDELTRVLANATSDIAVEMGPDAQGLVQDYDILEPTSVILKVAKGGKLTAHVPDLTVDVNGGIFDGNNKPHHVFLNSGSATAGRGSRVTALGGTFRERGGLIDAKTNAHVDNDAQAHISSGVVSVHGKAQVMADGNAEVYAFDDAKVDSFGRAKVRADDNVTLRAHDHSEGHLHGKAQGYASGPVVLTMVSPASKAQVGSSARLRVGEGVSHTQFSNSADVEPEFITAAEANLPDTLNRIRGRGKNAFHRNAPAAPIMDEEVAKFLEDREPGDPLNIAVMKAYEEGYRSQADAAAAMVAAVDAAEDANGVPLTDADRRLKTFTVTSPEGVREWQAEDEDHAREQHEDAFPEEPVIAVSSRNNAADEESCCAGCDCGNRCAQGCPVGPVCSEYDDNAVMCGRCSNPVEDCMCFSGPSFPLTEKVAAMPSYTDNAAVEDETLVKVGQKNGEPHTVQAFDWQRGRWGRSMIVAGGPGKELLKKLESVAPDARKVPANVAAAYGHATGKCLMCSKPLSDAASLSRGYGRSCAQKLG